MNNSIDAMAVQRHTPTEPRPRIVKQLYYNDKYQVNDAMKVNRGTSVMSHTRRLRYEVLREREIQTELHRELLTRQ